MLRELGVEARHGIVLPLPENPLREAGEGLEEDASRFFGHFHALSRRSQAEVDEARVSCFFNPLL